MTVGHVAGVKAGCRGHAIKGIGRVTLRAHRWRSGKEDLCDDKNHCQPCTDELVGVHYLGHRCARRCLVVRWL